MKYAIRLVVSNEAAQLSAKHDWKEIAKVAMRNAEALKLKDDDSAVFEGPDSLKIVVLWGRKEVHVVTREEAKRAYLPELGSMN